MLIQHVSCMVYYANNMVIVSQSLLFRETVAAGIESMRNVEQGIGTDLFSALDVVSHITHAQTKLYSQGACIYC